MATIVTRETTQTDGTSPKGSPLTNAEVDTNFINLNDDKVEVSGAIIFEAKAAEALSKGDVVYVSGVSGNTPEVSKADADDASKMPAYGLAEDAASLNAAVNVVTFGTLYDLDTSSFAVGDTVYVSTTAGAITTTAPTGESSLLQNIGTVIRSHASAGSIKVGGAGRTNATPNLNDGNVFIGNASNQAAARALTTADIQSGTFADARIAESNVTQHQAALSITESQISDLQAYLTAETNDLSSAVTWANVPDANITQSSVTQHEAALSITESQISDLQAYLTAESDTLDSVTDRGATTTNAITVGNLTSTAIDDNATSTAITIDSSQDVTFTSDAIFPDNGKAIFGAGSDLQIYHDGSNSIVQEVGTGDLRLAGNVVRVRNSADTENMISAVQDGAVTLSFDGNGKLSTTSTGIDVTGTAVTDGLTVAGNVSVDGGTIKLDGNHPTGTYNVALGDEALRDIQSAGRENTAIGRAAGANIETGNHNTAIGQNTLASISSVSFNTAVGSGALQNSTTANNTAVGYLSLYSNTTGTPNTAVGQSALYANTTGASNTSVGQAALEDNTTGSFNTAFGRDALGNNTTASSNTAVGYQAGYNNTTGQFNVLMGYRAGYRNTGAGSIGDANVFLGYQAGLDNQANNNVGIGNGSMSSNTSGYFNVAVGQGSLNSNTTAIYNVALGAGALQANTTASNNVAVGYQAGYSNTTGARLTAIGYLAGYAHTATGNVQSVFVGNEAGLANTSGTLNSFVGGSSGAANTTGSSNTALGQGSLASNTTASSNTALGKSSLNANTTGTDNSSGGKDSLASNTTGSYNTAFGSGALVSNTTAMRNTALGYQALDANQTGNDNVAVGHGALTASTSEENCAIGYGALESLSTGVRNTAVGYASGNVITTGSKNVILGRFSGNQGGLDIRTASNHIVLSDGDGNPRGIFDASGHLLVGTTVLTDVSSSGTGNEGAYIKSDGSIGLATSNGTVAIFNRKSTHGVMLDFRKDGTTVGSISTNGNSLPSDRNFKKNIEDLRLGLNFVSSLNPVTYNYKMDDDDSPIMTGLIAQDVETALEAAGVEPNSMTLLQHKPIEDEKESDYQMDYLKLVPVLINAVKELSAQVTELKAEVAALKGE